ncbi:hypothetical protein [Desulfobacterium sp. N47]|uniref:Uncharacterized protein n=1 Tax=uncultured Desulfobacterium sp. TaxID=201089 RepID=E1YBI4_9BACT|nr:unknown protein [uncultured Desulfobacterium sp.]
MKFIKFLLLAVGTFVVLVALLWVVINLWWLILALVALFIAYEITCEGDKEETCEEHKGKNTTS